MCGIVAELILAGPAAVDETVLGRMRDTMVHRGPDDAGLWVSPHRRVGLGHRRLSIVDLSPAGHQPMANEDGTIWIVFNGEIYNHAALRPELEQRGHRYRSHSDTETILHLYEEYGAQCVTRLDGMFAFALWDEPRGRLLLARDRMGKKPLYYWRGPDRLLVASEIKALLVHPCVSKNVDRAALYDYLSFSATVPPRTMFEGVRKLAASETMVIERDGATRINRYWNPLGGSTAPRTMSEAAAAEQLLHLLRRSIEKRMMADVPFGVFLSGGVDSSTNVALMAQLMNHPVDTFSVALQGDEQSNEFDWARRVANHFHCRHHEVVIEPPQFLEFAEQMPYYQDEPLADPVCVPLYFVSRLAREHGVIVVQVGEGSDEIFAGYTGYRDVLQRQRWAQRWQRWAPAWIRQLAVTLAPAARADFFRRLRDAEPIFWGAAIAFYETEKRALLTDAVPRGNSGQHVAQWYAEARDLGAGDNFLQQLTYVELRQRLAELLLMRVDKMGMAASIEARVPFLDYELVEFAMQLPQSLKVHGHVGKYILKQAVRPLLPAGVVDRPKRGFCGSATNMLQDSIRARLVADVRSSPWLRELIQPAALARLTAPAQQGANSFKLWNLWNLALWHRRWFT